MGRYDSIRCMRTILLTGATGDLGSVVLPRLQRDYRCEVLRRNDPLDRIASFAPLYGFVHLAGGFAAGGSPDDVSKMLETNLVPFVRTIDAAAPHLEEGGRIVAISSTSSLTLPAGLGAYNSSKAALNAFVQTLAKDLAKRNITVNALLPNSMDTDENLKTTPREKLVPRADVAETIAFLLSEAAARISGQLLALK